LFDNILSSSSNTLVPSSVKVISPLKVESNIPLTIIILDKLLSAQEVEKVFKLLDVIEYTRLYKTIYPSNSLKTPIGSRY